MGTRLHLPLNQHLGDASPFRWVATPNGLAGINASPAKYGSGACVFGSSSSSGSTNRLTLPASVLSDLGAQDFTMAAWARRLGPSSSSIPLFAQYTSTSAGLSIHVFVDATTFTFRYSTSGTSFSTLSVPYTIPAVGLWVHFAVTRTAGVLYFFVNGTRIGSASIGTASIFSSLGDLSIGGSGPFGGLWYGALDDVLIDIGTALWTADFTPSEVAYSETLTPALLPSLTHLSVFPVPSPSIRQHVPFAGSKDIYYGGNGQIIGTTKNTPALPVARRVRLHETKSGHVIREDWSDAAGNYAFTHLSRDYTYYVVGTDHTGQYQGVVADKLVPEVMP